jgi:hypothetical protein
MARCTGDEERSGVKFGEKTEGPRDGETKSVGDA